MNIMVEAIGFINDELIENAVKPIEQTRKDFGRYISWAAVIMIAFVSVFAGLKLISSGGGEPAPNPVITTKPYGAGDSGLVTGKLGNTIKTEGYYISDDEIKNHVETHKYNMIGAIAAEYGDFVSEYKIFTKGYRHINLGEENILNLNYVDLPIMREDKIVAVATIYENNGELRYQLSAGGQTFDERTEIFKSNPDDELVFLYYGMRELMVTPSNRIYCIGSVSEASLNLDYSFDYYKTFKTEYNSFSQDDLRNKDNYITVIPLPEEEITAYTPQEPEEIVTNSEGEELVATTKAVIITVKDVLSKEIVSVEWGNSYDLLMNKPFKKATDEQKNRIVQIISGVEPVIADDYSQYYGGGWIARLNYSDGTYALFCVQGKNQIIIENSEGVSPVYYDLSGNATEFENYLISLV